MLNQRLVEKQGLSRGDVAKIKMLHNEREMLFKKMEALDPVADRHELREHCVKDLERLEFALQEAWKFPQDAKMHSWWFRAPHCSCPYMDNQDMLGTEYKYINGDCPLHGGAQAE